MIQVIIDFTAPDTQAWINVTASSSAFLQTLKVFKQLFLDFLTLLAVSEVSLEHPSFLASAMPKLQLKSYKYCQYHTFDSFDPASAGCRPIGNIVRVRSAV